MRHSIATAIVLLLAAPAAHAQTRTEDGVDAYLRGDYQRAAEILKPIAESPFSTDHVASFFMATLYENGLGVPADATRACALYMRGDGNGPFGRLAQVLVGAAAVSLGSAGFEDCVRLFDVGFDHRFQPATFVLEVEHSIAIDLDGATVWYQGVEKHIELGLEHRGVWRPIEHSELVVAGNEPVRRHFIELFSWIPGANRTWVLLWRVFEVVRTDMIPIVSEEVATISGEQPPDDSSFDVRDWTRLSVNDDGQAEWAVLRGPQQSGGVIESEVERQGRNELKLARAAAEAKVDWARVRDQQRAPVLTYSDADGCGHVFVYGWSANRDEAVTIQADRELLGLSTTAQTFNIASRPGDLEVTVHVFSRAVRSWPFLYGCSYKRRSHSSVEGDHRDGDDRTVAARRHRQWVVRLSRNGPDRRRGIRQFYRQPHQASPAYYPQRSCRVGIRVIGLLPVARRFAHRSRERSSRSFRLSCVVKRAQSRCEVPNIRAMAPRPHSESL